MAGGVKTSGPVWRMDSHSGDIQTLVENAYYIGLHSSMLRESLRIAPQISLTPLPAPESQDHWTTVDIPSARISLKSPARWKIMPPVANSVWSALSSVDFSEGYGLAALDADQMVIYISRQPSYGSPDDYLQHRFMSQYRGQGAWQTMDLNGVTAYIQMGNVSQASPQTVLIPSSGGIITIVKYPFSSVYDPIFIQILKTIQLK
jgi:hypothetical protein